MNKFVIPQEKGFAVGFFADGTEPENAISAEGLTLPSASAVHWIYENGVFTVDEATLSLERRSKLKALSKRQFALYLDGIKATENPDDETTLYDVILGLLTQNKKASLEYETVAYIERNSATVKALTTLLGWSEEYVDQMWLEALTL
ncbi:MAG: hypothetical protein GX151_00570 [Gammaproteobacteria bacterium]|jgi:hypothetical protein|nr:hypothetical protein [Gammaproteobacteria bacterium]